MEPEFYGDVVIENGDGTAHNEAWRRKLMVWGIKKVDRNGRVWDRHQLESVTRTARAAGYNSGVVYYSEIKRSGLGVRGRDVYDKAAKEPEFVEANMKGDGLAFDILRLMGTLKQDGVVYYFFTDYYIFRAPGSSAPDAVPYASSFVNSSTFAEEVERGRKQRESGLNNMGTVGSRYIDYNTGFSHII